MTINNTNLNSLSTSVELSFDWEYDGMERISWTVYKAEVRGQVVSFCLFFDHQDQMYGVSASADDCTCESEGLDLGVAIAKVVIGLVTSFEDAWMDDWESRFEDGLSDGEIESLQEHEAIRQEYEEYGDYTHGDDNWDRDYPTDSIPF